MFRSMQAKYLMGFCSVFAGLLAGSMALAASPSTPVILITAPSAPLLDSDGDGIPDIWETTVYHTNPFKADTDGDGVSDRDEILRGTNPLGPGLLKDSDYDHDGLSDRLELAFGTDPTNPDTDGDGFKDGAEVYNGYSPTSTRPLALQKSITIHLKTHRLEQRVMGIAITSFLISDGKPGLPTPVGNFIVLNKSPKAWSRSAGLWMPYWMAFTKWGQGIHELPIWPSGYREGIGHLGHAVSHGCVRLGIGPAKQVYDWTPIGTPVIVTKN